MPSTFLRGPLVERCVKMRGHWPAWSNSQQLFARRAGELGRGNRVPATQLGGWRVFTRPDAWLRET